jgi:hypothetical protein
VGVPIGVDAFDLDINDTATLDISNCLSTPNTVTLTIGATMSSLVGSPRVAVVTQSGAGATSICVLKYHNITIETGKVLTIQNSSAVGQVLALEAEGTMTIQGTIVYRNAAVGSAGGSNTTATSGGHQFASGPGGGGNARAGGQGGACTAPACGSSTVSGGTGGAALSLSKLFAGSKGGDALVVDTGTRVGFGGLGGGGLQLIALQSITVGTTGRIDVNGLGGSGGVGNIIFIRSGQFPGPAGGGGAGGTLVIETPTLTISQGAIVAANGGGGASGCFTCSQFPNVCFHNNGQQGQLSATRATGGACTNGGNGGFGANGVLNPSPNGQNSDSGETVAGGGGGGGDGFIVLRTRDTAHLMIANGSVVSPSPMTGNVSTN